MTSSGFAAELLDASAPGFASLTAERLLERCPDLGERFGPRPLPVWMENISGRLQELALALSEERPQTFVDHVAWAKTAFAARGLPVDDLRHSLVCLREVLTEELPENARPPVESCLDQALERLDDLSATTPEAIDADTPAGRIAARYLVALLEGDRRRGSRVVLDAVDEGALSVPDAMLEVCLPAQRELGRMWHLNEITVAEEHFASAATAMVLSQLLARVPDPEPNGKTLIAASLEDDAHGLGVRVVADFFDMDGWRTVFLGTQLPMSDLAWAAKEFEADLVALSATLSAHRRAVADAISTLRRTATVEAPPVIVGGLAFADDPALWKAVGASGHALDARTAVALGRELVGLD